MSKCKLPSFLSYVYFKGELHLLDIKLWAEFIFGYANLKLEIFFYHQSIDCAKTDHLASFKGSSFVFIFF